MVSTPLLITVSSWVWLSIAAVYAYIHMPDGMLTISECAALYEIPYLCLCAAVWIPCVHVLRSIASPLHHLAAVMGLCITVPVGGALSTVIHLSGVCGVVLITIRILNALRQFMFVGVIAIFTVYCFLSILAQRILECVVVESILFPLCMYALLRTIDSSL